MYKYKPRPRTTDDICVKHNRKLKDYEIFGDGCQLCALEDKKERERSTVIHVLPPAPHKCKFCGAMTTQDGKHCYMNPNQISMI